MAKRRSRSLRTCARNLLGAFVAEWKELLDFAHSEGLLDTAEMAPWQTSYISEKLRSKKYGFDPESLRPYFPMESVMEGMFEICKRLYGLKVSRENMPGARLGRLC